MVDYDEAGSIGKRYRRQDEIGTPMCITVDFDTLRGPACVTVRDRDTMEQRITCTWTSWWPTSRRKSNTDSTKDRSDAGRDASFPRPF